MDTIGLFAWVSARGEMLRVEILPVLRSVSVRQFWYLFVTGQLKGFRTAWRASLSAHWSRGARRLVVRRLVAIGWDVLCLRAGDIHLARYYCRSSYEEKRRGAEASAANVAAWFPGQGETWGNPQEMRERAASVRNWEVWSEPDAPPILIDKAMRLMDRYDALALGSPWTEDRERVEQDREDACGHEIYAELGSTEMEIINAVAATRGLRAQVCEANETLARRPLASSD